MAGVMGYFVGCMVYTAFLVWTNNLYIYFGISIGLAITFAVLAWKMFERVLIFGTALLGSYVLVRGIAMFAGHFPNEIEIMQKLMNGEEVNFDAYFYIYFGSILVLFIGGYVHQYKRFKDEEDNDFKRA